MDKNFISIDDLVRQRFSGEEEKDRPAGWLQMRDLLDKEMPRDRGGFLYWRRTFGVAGLLLLATSIGVGSYLYGTRGLNGAGNGANSDAVAANTLITDNTNRSSSNSSTITGNKETSIAAVNTAANANHSKTKNSNDLKTAAADIVANSTTSNTNSVENKVAPKPVQGNALAGGAPQNTTKATTGNEVNTTTNNANELTAANNKKINTGHAEAVQHKTTAENVAGLQPAAHADKPVLASAQKNVAAKEHSDKAEKRRQFLANVIAANEQHKKAAEKKLLASNTDGNKHTQSKASHTTGSGDINTITEDQPKELASGGNAQKNTSHNSRKATSGKEIGVKNIAAIKPAGNHKTATGKNDQVTANKLALSSSTSTGKTTSTKSTTGITAEKVIEANDKPLAGNSSKHSAPKTGTPVQTSGNSTGHMPADKNKSGASRNGAQQGIAAIDAKEDASPAREKRSFERVLVNERFVSSKPADGYFKLDTISIEQLTREVAGDNGSNSRNRHNPAEPGKEESTDANENSNSAVAANTAIVPAASSSATAKNGLGKQNQSSKGSGESTLEKLNATFNDVKYHVSGTQFSPGLTGGINATFFGPNSFKGFQFGVTGNFSFGDNVAAMAEVKYFHRINNNYSLNDNYYTYTQVGNGQFSKQQETNAYSFSTLHSIEMPVSIRYTKSHFNFYAGGNFVYSFSINTGASTLQNTAAPTLVSAQGNDNAPRLQQDAFNSRFGVGYLMGLSYEVYPNLSLDFRSVQTVWDNAPSQGSKIVSGQLYKSPSFQVSIGYRLGGNKKKD